MDQLQAMRVFLKVVELHNFRLAGKQLGLSATTVSRSIALLEDHLKMSLISRSTRSLALTDAGHEYFNECQAIVEELDDVEAALGNTPRTFVGKLRIASLASFGMSALTSILQAYSHTYNAVSLDVHFFESSDEFRHRDFDISIVPAHAFSDDKSFKNCKIVLPETMIASPAYLEQWGRPRSPVDLADHDVLSINAGPIWTLQIRDVSGHYSIQPRKSLPSANLGDACQAVLSDMGIAIVPKILIDINPLAGCIEPVMSDYEVCGGRAQFALVYSPQRRCARTRSFLEFLGGASKHDHPRSAGPSPQSNSMARI